MRVPKGPPTSGGLDHLGSGSRAAREVGRGLAQNSAGTSRGGNADAGPNLGGGSNIGAEHGDKRYLHDCSDCFRLEVPPSAVVVENWGSMRPTECQVFRGAWRAWYGRFTSTTRNALNRNDSGSLIVCAWTHESISTRPNLRRTAENIQRQLWARRYSRRRLRRRSSVLD